MRVNSPNLGDNPYLKSIDFKLKVAEYQHSRLEAEIAQDRWNTRRLENENSDFILVLSAYFDGLMHQLHTTQDLLAQLLSSVLNLDENPEHLHLSSILKDEHCLKRLHADIHSVTKDFYDSTGYLRSYMNYSKHRNLILPYHQYILTTMVCISTAYIDSFEYRRIEYPQKTFFQPHRNKSASLHQGLTM